MSSHRAEFKWKAMVGASIVFIIPLFIAIGMNYAFFAIKGYAAGEFNMFWISPYFTTQIPILGSIKPLVPYPVFVLIYILGFVVLANFVRMSATLLSKIRPSQKFLALAPATK